MNGHQCLAGGDRSPQPQGPPASGAAQRTAPAISLFGVPETPGGFVQVSIELRWCSIGEICPGQGCGLGLPDLPAEPGLYRLRRFDETGGHADFVGEAPDLARRFAGYADPASSGRHVGEAIRAHLARGGRIELALVTSERTLRVAGRVRAIDLADKSLRRLLDQAARIAEGALPIGAIARG